jgi:hypothetical protein
MTQSNPEQISVRAFLEGLRSDFAALAADPALVKEEHEENLLWDGAIRRA